MSSKRQKHICFIGAFPPPILGMAVVNAAMKTHLLKKKDDPIIINTASKSLKRSWLQRIVRMRKLLNGLVKFLRVLLKGKTRVLYLSLSGGTGQIYDIVFILFARMTGISIILHHHSYAYLSKRKLVTRILTNIAGPSCLHVVLCNDMKKKLKDHYCMVKRVLVVSNSVIIKLDQIKKAEPRKGLRVLGFLGNISKEKGVLEYIEVFNRLIDQKIPLRGIIAGPFQSKEIERIVRKQIQYLDGVEYVGPQYNDEKNAFYENIDLLLFPTSYINEAEPLTIYEAMSFGVPVIARQRGCIESIITPSSGLVVKPDEDYVSIAVRQIKKWYEIPDVYKQVSIGAASRLEELASDNSSRFKQLLGELKDQEVY